MGPETACLLVKDTKVEDVSRPDRSLNLLVSQTQVQFD